MPYKYRRACPLCESENLLSLSDHLRKVHRLSIQERRPYLQMAAQRLYDLEETSRKRPTYEHERSLNEREPREAEPMKRPRSETSYPDFCFKHPFSMLVVGPTQSGKTHFVEQMLTSNLMEFPANKDVQVTWFYNQWQPRYKRLKKELGAQITFEQGLPDWSDTLEEINPKMSHVLVFDDLMSQAVDSPILSRLFTQGRHRNASVILLMQNMFPKGKYNTDISRNAQYLVLFRSPNDRKQVDIIAERIFAKDRPQFMQVYSKATQMPYGYVLIDNQPCTAPEYQVVTDVFGQCQRHSILGSTQPPRKRLCVEKTVKSLPEESESEQSEESDLESLTEESESEPESELEESEESELEDYYSRENIPPEEMEAAINFYLSFSYPERARIVSGFGEV